MKNRYYFRKQETALEIQHELLNGLDFSFCFFFFRVFLTLIRLIYEHKSNISADDKIKLIERKRIYNRWHVQQIANSSPQ